MGHLHDGVIFTTSTRILLVFRFVFKFVNPSEVLNNKTLLKVHTCEKPVHWENVENISRLMLFT